ncbi:cell wall-binding repeat-containing protein [Salinibacterium sp. SWN1162]|uniref:cell wall-binding repeat-containing protein n=1 Tax=Salinibacterium sp. SWN1162 TaxID=2792053 RepID=UPI0018CFCC54|nr:cell wall-binding repeat-containing protein [Salinibacterium sp. SWN1162]MBH0008762.1 cell wall-binding repeat-containing protein [Salinibacterium sp. SWN1162]
MHTFSSVRSGVFRAAAVIGAVAVLAASIVVPGPADSASAYSGSEFDPGNIISDDEFYNGSAMTESQIQAFLNGKTGVLKTLRQDVDTRPKEVSSTTKNLICNEIKGGKDLLASTIIYRAQVACGISAKVILATLQKEQGLITNSKPTSWNINNALGYGCPDDGGCSADYEGFGYQVFTGTRQFKAYKAANFGKQPGSHTIAYHPYNSKCGTKSVKISNYATAALYNYTPYLPNSAALANLGGVGDSCSSYGNRNFWDYYYSWFGNPTDITPSVSVSRVSGQDRFIVSSALSKKAYSTAGIDRVYVATGMDFPDALSAAAAAAAYDGPLLLVTSSAIPSSTATELKRLKPKEIVVVGGTGAISKTVYNSLSNYASKISRISGGDRYESSRLIAESAFPAGTTTSAYIATGTTFADALSASSAAAAAGSPVILVSGKSSKLDAETTALLKRLGITSVTIAGGSGAVSSGIESNLKSLLGSSNVTRIGGQDRFIVSAAINDAAFDSAETVYIASGFNFPDALSGAAVAGAQSVPLYIVQTTCVPKAVLQQIKDLGARDVVLLGGTSALSSKVAKLTNCAS